MVGQIQDQVLDAFNNHIEARESSLKEVQLKETSCSRIPVGISLQTNWDLFCGISYNMGHAAQEDAQKSQKLLYLVFLNYKDKL